MSGQILLDTDACPVSDLVSRTAECYGLSVMVVANVPIRTEAVAREVARNVIVPLAALIGRRQERSAFSTTPDDAVPCLARAAARRA